jgi:hypothetical protein
MYAYQSRLYELQSFTGTPGTSQSLQYDIRGLPAGQRVEAFMLVCDFTAIASSAGATTTSYNLVAKSLAQFDHASEFLRVRATGAGLFHLFRHMNGKSLDSEVITLTGGGTTDYFRAVAVIPVADRKALAPADCSIPTELLNGTSLQLNTTANDLSAIISPSAGSITSGSVAYRLFACLVEGAGALDPTPSVVDYEDWGGQTILLRPGAYSHLLTYFEDGTPVNLAPGTSGYGIQRVTFNIAGTPVLQNVFSWANVIEYNRVAVAGGFVPNSSTQSQNQELANNSVPFLPVFTPPEKYKISGLPQSSNPDAILQFNGGATNFRVLYRRLPEKTESQIRAAAQKFGMGSFQRDIKTASGKSLAQVVANSSSGASRAARVSKFVPGMLSKAPIRGR